MMVLRIEGTYTALVTPLRDTAGQPIDWDAFDELHYARQIDVARPGDDYQLQIAITKATFNETIAPDRFILPQPPGTKLVRVGEESGEDSKESQP